MTTQHTNNDQLLGLGQTIVSRPSILHRSQSEQSITASEDYYSLSSGSSRTIPANVPPQHTIQRFSTPPSRYRTPLQSRDNLGAYSAVSNPQEQQTALRGTGQRRHSSDLDSPRPAGSPTFARDVRRKPVPSTVMEGSEGSILPGAARSSAAIDISRTQNAPTPDVDDTPFIHFALDQLTRDEEVRGSRAYLGPKPAPQSEQLAESALGPAIPVREHIINRPIVSQQKAPAAQVPPPRNPNRPASATGWVPIEPRAASKDADVFLPLAASPIRPLHFVPGILRPSRLALFLFLVLIYLAWLLLAAIYSLRFTGMWTYNSFGDNRYFVFRYLPTLLGMLLLLWLFQIQIAVARIAPFLAMSSPTPRVRDSGVDLPIYINDLLMPKLRYLRARLFAVGIFMNVAWLQIFTIPLLAAAFNVYYVGENWRWTAVQGLVWAVIGLYLILFASVILLAFSLRRLRETGLRWDPRSLADLVVMLERSNALDDTLLVRQDVARLGFWRTSKRPNDAFHTFGYANLEPRRYGVDAGRIQEKRIARDSADTDVEANRWRHSRDAMLAKDDGDLASTISYPWFLRVSATLLWAIIALVLLLAFLIISYLPSTVVFNGFFPSVPVIVDSLGFGADNFLFSFIPAVLAMLCLLFWVNIDYTLRRFAPITNLLQTNGGLAEHNLLLAYPADFPLHVTLAAAANGDWRVSWVSLNTLIAATLPVLAGGVFWAQFDVATQSVRIYAHTTGFYALTALVAVYALSYILLLPFSRTDRDLAIHAPRRGNHVQSFADIIALVRNSKILDDFAFHGPVSKVDLVTRLLSVQPGAKVDPRISTIPEAGTSMLSLADSLRGFGNARQRAIGGGSIQGVPKYGLTRWSGRDGTEHFGIDRFR